MDLVDQAKQGNQQAWNELVAKYQRRVMFAALAVVQDLDEADDITQEVFVKLYTNLAKLRNPKALKSWLVKTAYNKACDRRRFLKIRGWFNKREDPDTLVQANNLSQIENAQLREVINSWSENKLSAQESIVLQLKVGDEMTFEEIAEVLNSNASTAKTHYYRALEKLKGGSNAK